MIDVIYVVFVTNLLSCLKLYFVLKMRFLILIFIFHSLFGSTNSKLVHTLLSLGSNIAY